MLPSIIATSSQVNYESAEQVSEVIVEQMIKQLKLQTKKLVCCLGVWLYCWYRH